MTWFEIRTLLRERPMPGIPRDLLAAIEAETFLRRSWWQSDAFQLRWVPALLGVATVLGALWLARVQKHPDARAAIPMAARPQPAKETLHAFLSSNEMPDQEIGESREHSKS